MSKSVDLLMPKLERLSKRDRKQLANFLLATLDAEERREIERAWEIEIDRRVREIRSGKVAGRPAEEASADVRNKLSDGRLLIELERRLKEIRSGKEKGISERKILAQLRKEFP